VDRALGAAARRSAREQSQSRNVSRLAGALGLPITKLPLLLEGAGTPEAIATLARAL
jgi:hypothetical protein